MSEETIIEKKDLKKFKVDLYFPNATGAVFLEAKDKNMAIQIILQTGVFELKGRMYLRRNLDSFEVNEENESKNLFNQFPIVEK